MASKFYERGLNFACARCSGCCRHEPGYVFLRQSDLDILVKAVEMRYTDFMETYCRWIPSGDGTERLSLKEKKNFDCVFWETGCSLYEYRPLQCRSFPFWPSVLVSSTAWKRCAETCPGMNHGTLHSSALIETWLEQQEREPFIIRRGA